MPGFLPDALASLSAAAVQGFKYILFCVREKKCDGDTKHAILETSCKVRPCKLAGAHMASRPGIRLAWTCTSGAHPQGRLPVPMCGIDY